MIKKWTILDRCTNIVVMLWWHGMFSCSDMEAKASCKPPDILQHPYTPVCHRSWLESELTAHCFKFKPILDNTSLLWLIHCYVTIRHRTTIVSARIRANGNFGDVSMEWLHSVSVRINHVMSQDLRFWGKTFVLISCSKHCLGTRNFRGHSPKCPRRDYGPVMSPSDAVDLESPLIGLLWWI